jgi:hypothetical protein
MLNMAMNSIRMQHVFWAATLFLCTCAPLACTRSAAAGYAPPSSSTIADARMDIAEIPLPKKNTMLPVVDESQWRNPFLSVGDKMLLLRIYLPDANLSGMDRGGFTRSSNARKQELNLRLRDLPRALASLPQECWPYGRVVAVARGFLTQQNQTQLLHNEKLTLQTLQTLGVMAKEWPSGGTALQ